MAASTTCCPGCWSGWPASCPDEYRVAAVLHPNIWHGHGTGQIRTWLDRACRNGLTLIDPLDGWRQALIAADAVIGDFGSVSYYAAALGLPVLLGAASGEVLDPDSPVGLFTSQARRWTQPPHCGPNWSGC
ncbi:hypothetical protein [Streptacidiphilus sp. P02-A3a]|uniref:hypothetical protein n=1 Tax=Streptacidiphilus sp. P02-A3a TaxID=2704468 RepID=UPI00351A0CF6